ncbi:hypothetical protein BDK51DRAFT_32405, partial [Blyttiomyces helicus]
RGDWIARVFGTPGMRSINVERHLTAGRYSVQVKIDRMTNGGKPRSSFIDELPGEVMPMFLKVGKSYDLAHEKAGSASVAVAADPEAVNADDVDSPGEGPGEADKNDAPLFAVSLRVYSQDSKSNVVGFVSGGSDVAPDVGEILDPGDVHAGPSSLRSTLEKLGLETSALRSRISSTDGGADDQAASDAAGGDEEGEDEEQEEDREGEVKEEEEEEDLYFPPHPPFDPLAWRCFRGEWRFESWYALLVIRRVRSSQVSPEAQLSPIPPSPSPSVAINPPPKRVASSTADRESKRVRLRRSQNLNWPREQWRGERGEEWDRHVRPVLNN